MKTLFIDTHLFDINIMLIENGIVVKEKSVIGEKYNSKYLMPAVKFVCDGEDYRQIVVVNGPGSFTGVRLGVTVAKTLAYTQNIPIKSISSLDMINYSCNTPDHICAINDGNGFFIGEYSNYKKSNKFFYLSNSDYSKYALNKDIITNVTYDFVRIFKYLDSITPLNPHSVNPIYIKKIGVEK